VSKETPQKIFLNIYTYFLIIYNYNYL